MNKRLIEKMQDIDPIEPMTRYSFLADLVKVDLMWNDRVQWTLDQ